jgi:hypothetical protein
MTGMWYVSAAILYRFLHSKKYRDEDTKKSANIIALLG